MQYFKLQKAINKIDFIIFTLEEIDDIIFDPEIFESEYTGDLQQIEMLSNITEEMNRLKDQFKNAQKYIKSDMKKAKSIDLAESDQQENTKKNKVQNIKEQINKVNRRIKNWGKNTEGKPHIILKSFFALKKQNTDITVQDLCTKCEEHGLDNMTFYKNYPQLKNFGKHNHGKVFQEIDGYVTIWEKVAHIIKKEWEQ